MTVKKLLGAALGAVLLIGSMAGCGEQSSTVGVEKKFINVSYDPTRELFAAYNDAFKDVWKELSKEDVTFEHLHGGSGKQARLVIEGQEADVVTLALAADVDEISDAGLIKSGWINRFPSNSAPYTSTVVFLVRAGNPKDIRDWDDLIRDDVSIVTPNPKTSGGARWNYLAAWEYARQKYDGDETQIRAFIKKMFENVVALDTGARGSTNSFVLGKKGDVLIAWENEALLGLKEAPNEYELVTPSISILAEPSVAVVDAVVDRKGTRRLAEEYIRYLYSPAGQELVAANFYRPRNSSVLAKYSKIFKPLTLVTIDDAFGGWRKAQAEHFADGAIFYQLYHP